MCGVVGIFTTGVPTTQDMKLLRGLLLVDQIRGEHATGIAKVNVRTNEVSIHKRAYNAVDFLALESTEEFLTKDMGQLYIGHNRYATMGNKSEHANAHPFQHEHITLVHNGGVDYWGLDMLEGNNDKDVVVDSHMVCMTIAKHGIKKAVEEHLSGAFALVWWDSKERSLNFIRNSDRPLYMCVLTNGTIAWASEKGMLDVFCKREGKQSGYRIEPTMLHTDKLYKIPVNEYGNKVGTVPVCTPMNFLELSAPKQSGAADAKWWNDALGNNYTTSPKSSAANYGASSGHNVANIHAPRVNSALDKMGSKLRYRSLVTVDITSFVPYVSSPKYGIATGIARDTGEVIQAWGLDVEDMAGVTVIRGNVTNAYVMLVKGVSEPSITIDCVGMSCHDPKYSRTTALVIRTSSNQSQPAGSTQESNTTSPDTKPKEGTASLGKTPAEAAKGVLELRANNLAKVKQDSKPNRRPDIHFPLKVCGHTFVTASEFREYVQIGCAQCKSIPTAYDTWNNYLCVYASGNIVSADLSDTEFCCGECEGVH